MILPRLNKSNDRPWFGPPSGLHPIWEFGYFHRYGGQIIIGPWVGKSEVVYTSGYPHTSWANAKVIFRAYLREVGE